LKKKLIWFIFIRKLVLVLNLFNKLKGWLVQKKNSLQIIFHICYKMSFLRKEAINNNIIYFGHHFPSWLILSWIKLNPGHFCQWNILNLYWQLLIVPYFKCISSLTTSKEDILHISMSIMVLTSLPSHSIPF